MPGSPLSSMYISCNSAILNQLKKLFFLLQIITLNSPIPTVPYTKATVRYISLNL